MIYGIGIDLIEVERIARQLIGKTHFREKIFSLNEIAYCDAARFAAKEALFKALGTGWRGGLNFTEVEVLNDDLGKPAFNFLGKTSQIIEELNLTHIHLSLSHLAQIAVAIVILEK